MNKIGFVGIGKMGMPIACNLLKDGYEVTACDLDWEALQLFTKRGGRQEESLGRLVARCDTVFLCLPGFRETEQVMQGPEGILAEVSASKIVVDLGSGDPYKTGLIAKEAEGNRASYLDAPIEGSVKDAAAGTLTIMVGGPYAAYEEIKDVLDKIGRQIFYMGTSGTGHKTRLVHTLISWTNLVVLCEAMVLGVKAGLEPDQILTVINAGAAESYVSRRYGPQIIKDNDNNENTLIMDRQYLENILMMETETRATLPLVGLVSQFIVAAKSMGLSPGNISAVLKLYEEMARIEVRIALPEEIRIQQQKLICWLFTKRPLNKVLATGM